MSLGHGMDLSTQQEAEYAKLRARLDAGKMPVKPHIEGNCTGCGRPLPVGGLYMVPKVVSVNENGYQRRVAKEIYCRQPCVPNGTGHNGHKHHLAAPAPVANPAERVKTLARGMLAAIAGLDAGVKFGPKWVLGQLALTDADKPLVTGILKKMVDAGKVEEVETEKGTRYRKPKPQ